MPRALLRPRWPAGVVFDLDGTLILSRHDFSAMQRAIVELAVRHGADERALVVTDPVGTSEILAAAHSELTRVGRREPGADRFDREVDRRLEEIELRALPTTTLRSGARELLGYLRGYDYRLGLFTRASGAFTAGVLDRFQLGDFFHATRSRGDPGPAKPSPEALVRLLAALDLGPSDALYVGDHSDDARCATGAGVAFWAVLPGEGPRGGAVRQGFLEQGASVVLPDLDHTLRRLKSGARRLGSPPVA